MRGEKGESLRRNEEEEEGERETRRGKGEDGNSERKNEEMTKIKLREARS